MFAVYVINIFMILFFDGVSTQGYIGLYTTQKTLLCAQSFSIAGNESTKTIWVIHAFLKENHILYEDIEHIVCVVGPGSFTGVRTISLVINTLAYVYPHITLTGISFFDLYDSYPVVKSSSKRDLFVKYEKSATIQVVPNHDFEAHCDTQSIYGDVDVTRFKKDFTLISKIPYDKILAKIELQHQKQLSPLYIKKPNIS